MNLVNFIPQYLDLTIQTIGPRGVWLSIPTIMKKGEWGEVCFFGPTPKDPLIIKGPITEPHVIGTARLQSGHYTFPPEEALDEHGQKIEFRELANVYFEFLQKNLLTHCDLVHNDSNQNIILLLVL